MAAQKFIDDGSVSPVTRSVPAVADSPAMRAWAQLLVGRARADGVELTGRSVPIDRDGPSGAADRHVHRDRFAATAGGEA